MMNAPVLLIVFNRPEHARIVAEAICKSDPPIVYIAADGPRPDVPDDPAKCKATREAVESVQWKCPVETSFQTNNLTCAAAVTHALNWFFDKNECGIVLEDDCLPDPSAFNYFGNLLDRFRDEDRVGCITGNNFQHGRKPCLESYYFSRYNHCWGWATWARQWSLFDFNMNSSQSDSEIIKSMGCGDVERRYWQQQFARTRSGQINTWDYQWMWSLWHANKLTATPAVNLVENIGYGIGATHTYGKSPGIHAEPMEFPLRHPDIFAASAQRDHYVAMNHFRLSRWHRFRSSTGRILRSMNLR
ncbi:hypothetical protein Poly51_53680 [Rubripirellula tenax]|uniref:GNT-I family protein n=1 Tax=Rubripirellula tenax TaxID=2528015 RepID=A0A5C6EFL7_9BACT|nr:glycosyltransferase family 2 protein [Rubripirellula tenax]TWU47568.1 hypothetical protein Poly51_53680 [Rubripirellula tenax]